MHIAAHSYRSIIQYHRMRSKVKHTILSLLAVALLGVGASAQTQKIGFVNSAKIFQELPAAQDVQKRIDAMTKPLQDSLALMQDQYKALVEDYQKKEALMNDATKKSEQQRIIALEQRFNDFRLQKFGTDGDVAKQTEKLLSPLRENIRTAIGVVAKQERYNFVFDKTDQIQILIYGDPAHDLTFKVIDRLKRGK
jgi:outer membrane protein